MKRVEMNKVRCRKEQLRQSFGLPSVWTREHGVSGLFWCEQVSLRQQHTKALITCVLGKYYDGMQTELTV